MGSVALYSLILTGLLIGFSDLPIPFVILRENFSDVKREGDDRLRLAKDGFRE
jgi:hypothetical protein